MKYTVILANTMRQAMEHAKQEKLPKGRFRYAAHPSSIHGLRTANVHVLPEFGKRRDKHAILAKLRYAKVDNLLIFDEAGKSHSVDPTLVTTPQKWAISERVEPASEDVPVKRKKAPSKPPKSARPDWLPEGVDPLGPEAFQYLPPDHFFRNA